MGAIFYTLWFLFLCRHLNPLERLMAEQFSVFNQFRPVINYYGNSSMPYRAPVSNPKNIQNPPNTPSMDYYDGQKPYKKPNILLLTVLSLGAAALLGLALNYNTLKKLFNSVFQTSNTPKTPKKPHHRSAKSSKKPAKSKRKHSPSPQARVRSVRNLPPNPVMQRLTALVDKDNVTSRELRQIENIFNNYTGLTLHCPESYDFRGFLPFFSTTVRYGDYRRIDPAIKHIILAHGTGSVSSGNWRFTGSGNSVFDYVESVVPRGEKALLVVCESGRSVRPGVGTSVTTSLSSPDSPGKVVESGIRRIIGTFITTNGGRIQYF